MCRAYGTSLWALIPCHCRPECAAFLTRPRAEADPEAVLTRGGRTKEGRRGGAGLPEGSPSVVREARGGSSAIAGRDRSWKREGDRWRFTRRGGRQGRRGEVAFVAFRGRSLTRCFIMFLRRIAGPLLASVKESTGIVGLDVVPNAREVLITLYQQTLKAVQPIPESAQYRKSVEALTHHRLKVCQEEQDWENIEKRIQGGQVEELIVQAKDELQLIPKMAEWKPWEVPEGYKVEVIEDDDSIPSHVPYHK